MKFKVEITPLQSGRYIACVPGLPGCIAEGNSQEEVISAAKVAIEIYLRALNDDPGARTPDSQLIELDV